MTDPAPMGQHTARIEGSQATLPGSTVKTEWVLITPELASAYLDFNEENRSVSDRHVDRITDDMEQDRFKITHQGLAFNDHGVLVDGQHRCMAVVRSGKPQWMLVTTGIDREGLDIGKVRAPHDFKKCVQRISHSSAVKILLGARNLGTTFTASSLKESYNMVTKQNIEDHWMQWPLVEEWENLAAKAAKNVRASGTAGLLAAAAVYPGQGEEFLTGLRDMTGLSVGDPRAALLKWNKSALRVTPTLSAVLALKTIGAMARGEEMHILKVSGLHEKVRIPAEFML
jgi:hypothetical protein